MQYPEERLSLAPRFRGYEFTWYEERCTVCATCAKACPHGVIRIVSEVGEDNKFRAKTFDIDIARCLFCGLCAEACPFKALYMGSSFEMASYHRARLLIGRDELATREKKPSTYALERADSEWVGPEEQGGKLFWGLP